MAVTLSRPQCVKVVPLHLCWPRHSIMTWRRFHRLLALCEGNLPMTGGSHHKGPIMRNCNVSFNISLKKVLEKQSICRWFKTSWRSCDVTAMFVVVSRSTSGVSLERLASADPCMSQDWEHRASLLGTRRYAGNCTLPSSAGTLWVTLSLKRSNFILTRLKSPEVVFSTTRNHRCSPRWKYWKMTFLFKWYNI